MFLFIIGLLSLIHMLFEYQNNLFVFNFRSSVFPFWSVLNLCNHYNSSSVITIANFSTISYKFDIIYCTGMKLYSQAWIA